MILCGYPNSDRKVYSWIVKYLKKEEKLASGNNVGNILVISNLDIIGDCNECDIIWSKWSRKRRKRLLILCDVHYLTVISGGNEHE